MKIWKNVTRDRERDPPQAAEIVDAREQREQIDLAQREVKQRRGDQYL